MGIYQNLGDEKLVVKFMGYELITPEMRRTPGEWYTKDGIAHSYWENHNLKASGRVLCSENGLSYGSSWNWLMPVIAKIYEMEEYEDYKVEFSDIFINPCDIISTFNDVVKFIKWYNNQNK